MNIQVPRGVQAFLLKVTRHGGMPSPALVEALMMTHRVQTWFQHHGGLAMTRRQCHACARAQTFTIWVDGSYRCMRCLFRQAQEGLDGPVPLHLSDETLREFIDTWNEYGRRFEAEDAEGWPLADEIGGPFGLTRPAILCEDDVCPTCEVCRPHVRRPDGKTRCVCCLVRYLRKGEIRQIPRHSTRERLDYAARMATRLASL